MHRKTSSLVSCIHDSKGNPNWKDSIAWFHLVDEVCKLKSVNCIEHQDTHCKLFYKFVPIFQ